MGSQKNNKTSRRAIMLGLLVTLGVMVLYLAHPRFIEVMELKILDLHFRSRGSIPPLGSDIMIAAIDQKSIDELGRWPWSRRKIKSLIESLAEAGAKIIAFDVTFPSSEHNILDEFITGYWTDCAQDPNISVDITQQQNITKILSRIDPDLDLSKAIKKAGNVILGMFFFLSPEEAEMRGKESIDEEPAYLTSQSYPIIQQLTPEIRDERYAKAYGFVSSIDELAGAAWANGFFNMYPDFDGVYRWAPLLIEYKGQFYPSMDMQIIKHFWNLSDDSLLIQLGEYGIENMYIEGIPIPVDERGNLLINYRGPHGTYPHYSASDIVAHRIPKEKIKDKIVLVGTTATGLYDLRYTPFKIMAGVEIHANNLDNFLNMNFLSVPKNYFLLDLFILLTLGIVLGIALSITYPLIGSLLTGTIMISYIWFTQYLFSARGTWINLIYPIIEILISFIAINLYRYASGEKEKKDIKRSFEHYLAPTLVQELIQNPKKLDLGGEKKILSVLFSDIRGFTSIAEQMDPEKLISFLNDYFRAMSSIILNHAGLLDKFIGDAIMAVYCAPLFREDHAFLACQTALEMCEALKEINQRFTTHNLPEIKIGIGINSGEMVIGNVGSQHRLAYTVLGDNVNLSFRLEQLTKIYGVKALISESTYTLVKDQFTTRELDFTLVKGRTQMVKIYELAGRIEDALRLAPLHLCFMEGLIAYRSCQWAKAIEKFKEALTIAPADGPSHYYLKRCQEYQDMPSSPDWQEMITSNVRS